MRTMLIVLVLSALCAAQSTWHVNSVSGNDGFNGSIDAPLRTLGEMARRINSGIIAPKDTVVLTGVFTEANTTVTRSVHIRASAPREQIDVRGSGFDPARWAPWCSASIDAGYLGAGLIITGDRVTISDIEVRNATAGIVLVSCDGCAVTSCIVHDIAGVGIQGGHTTNGRGHDNRIADCLIARTDGDGFQSADMFAWTIERNRVALCGWTVDDTNVDGISMHGSIGGQSHIRDNVVERVRGKSGICLNVVGAVGTWASVERNVVRDCLPAPSALLTGGQGIVAIGNSNVTLVENRVEVASGERRPRAGIAVLGGLCRIERNIVINRSPAADSVSIFCAGSGIVRRNTSVCFGPAKHAICAGSTVWDDSRYYPGTGIRFDAGGPMTSKQWRAQGLDARITILSSNQAQTATHP